MNIEPLPVLPPVGWVWDRPSLKFERTGSLGFGVNAFVVSDLVSAHGSNGYHEHKGLTFAAHVAVFSVFLRVVFPRGVLRCDPDTAQFHARQRCEEILRDAVAELDRGENRAPLAAYHSELRTLFPPYPP